MQTTPLLTSDLGDSVIAVPPLARTSQGTYSPEANRRIINYLEQGGIKTLLYGGNAVFYHIRLSEYATVLSELRDAAADSTRLIPSVGPAFGIMMDQAQPLIDLDYPTAMVLPQLDVSTPDGRATGIRLFAERLGKPIVLYLKQEPYLTVPLVKQLVDDGLVCAIKYAVVRDDPATDNYLSELIGQVDPQLMVSGIGEQPAPIHLRQFGLNGFTSGCVCIAPSMSMSMLAALKQEDDAQAENIRRQFFPLEDLRNSIHPIRVLHAAVRLAKIADTGPISPLLSDLDSQSASEVQTAAEELLALEQNNRDNS